jgi:hypothetical protein
MHKLRCFHLLAAALAFAALVGAEARSAEFEGAPNRHRRLKRCRSS